MYVRVVAANDSYCVIRLLAAYHHNFKREVSVAAIDDNCVPFTCRIDEGIRQEVGDHEVAANDSYCMIRVLAAYHDNFKREVSVAAINDSRVKAFSRRWQPAMKSEDILCLLKEAVSSQPARSTLANLNNDSVPNESIKASIYVLQEEAEALSQQGRMLQHLLTSVHQWYSHIRECIVQNQALLAPIRRIPNEILLEIFLVGKALGTSTIIAIIGTCRRWRQIIFNHNCFWKELTFTGTTPVSPFSVIPLYLHYGTELSISIDRQWFSLFYIPITPMQYHLTSCLFKLVLKDSCEFISVVCPMLPSLVKLEIEGIHSIFPTRLLENSPNLVELSIILHENNHFPRLPEVSIGDLSVQTLRIH
ncbi:hypothetical protein M422DRAFT_243818 [Sphaerobolus stellatus SS14]|nr:hypothetical protein M422DRAFT_243818 [Sphaerobolus stellatus SS14]